MIHDPDLLPREALRDVAVGLSVSDSPDLGRLGLDLRHANLVVGEIARAVLIAGGEIVYGGRLRPSGFTQQLMNEVRRFGTTRHSLTLCLALPEHMAMSDEELDQVDRQLGTWGRLLTLDAQGRPIPWRDRQLTSSPLLTDEERAYSYSGLRRHMADLTHGRILVGGQLRGYKGSMPGLIEEARLAIQRGQPLYIAGGFGGAATAIARRLRAGSFEWLPDGIPEGEDDLAVQDALALLEGEATEHGWSVTDDGLTPEQRSLLCASHRPGEIASLSVIGLAARFTDHPESQA
jgi:hypothetical protein